MVDRILRLALTAGTCALASCATLPDAPTTGSTSAPAATVAAAVPSAQAIASAQRLAGAPGSTATATTPPALRPFAEVSRDAKEMTGLFHLWQKDDKVWLEIGPEQFDHAYFFSTNLDQGLGESGFLAGSMSSSLSRRFGGPQIVIFRKIGTNVQLIARNAKYMAHARHAGGARRGRRLLGQPAGQRRHRVAAPSRTQVGPDRGQCAAVCGYSRRRVAPRAGVPAVLCVRFAQHVLR